MDVAEADKPKVYLTASSNPHSVQIKAQLRFNPSYFNTNPNPYRSPFSAHLYSKLEANRYSALKAPVIRDFVDGTHTAFVTARPI